MSPRRLVAWGLFACFVASCLGVTIQRLANDAWWSLVISAGLRGPAMLLLVVGILRWNRSKPAKAPDE